MRTELLRVIPLSETRHRLCIIFLKERQGGVFHAVWSTDIDPSDKFIDSSQPPSPGPLLRNH